MKTEMEHLLAAIDKSISRGFGPDWSTIRACVKEAIENKKAAEEYADKKEKEFFDSIAHIAEGDGNGGD